MPGNGFAGRVGSNESGRVASGRNRHYTRSRVSFPTCRTVFSHKLASGDSMLLEIVLAVSLQDIGWLAGEWQIASASQCVEERWTGASSNMLVGMSRTMTDGRTTSFEFVRIEARADGIYYVAQPGGRPPVDFRLAPGSASELVFENPGHADRLRKVIYRRGADGSLTARIEGENGGKAFSEEYAYRRLASGAPRCGTP